MPDLPIPAAPTTKVQTAAGRFARVRLEAREWWVFALRGVAALLFAGLAFAAPAFGLALILGMLAAWLAIDGVATLVQAARGARERHRLAFWLDGALSLVAAALLLFLPVVSAIALVVVVGAWAVVAGVARLVMAVRMRSVLLGLFGVVTIMLGVWLLIAPGPGLLALIWLVGLQAAMAGALLLGMAWRLRRIHHDPHGPALVSA